jgi:type I restriction enzyme S subunit
MSELPKGWAETTLDEIQQDFSQGINPASYPDEEFELFSVPSYPNGVAEVVRGRDIGSNKQTVIPNAVLLCKINPRINRVWVVDRKTDLRSIASTEWIPFWPVHGINPNYLAYYLRQNHVRDFLAQNASGVGGSLMRIKPSTFARFRFVLAPREEQTRIVAEIEKQFTRLDAATAALKRVQANLKRYRASVLKAACEGQLVPTEAALARKEGRDFEPASELLKRILRERRARWEADTLAKMIASGKPPKDDRWKLKYIEPATPDISNLPELPEGWCWALFDQLIVSGPQNGLYKPATAYGSGCPIVRIDDYQNDFHRSSSDLRRLRLSDEERKLYQLGADDVLVNRVNSPSHLGKSIAAPAEWSGAVFESNMMRLRVATSVSVSWLMVYLHSNEGRTRLTSNAKWAVNQASINQEDVKATPIPLPPEMEEARIAESFANVLTEVQRTMDSVAAGLVRSGRLKQSVLNSAFSGRLAPQDSRDEPAVALLERIRAERAGQVSRHIRPKRVAVGHGMEVI